MEQNIVTFRGGNKDLFTRTLINEVSDKLTIIVPETHNAILVKDGQMLQTLSSGKYFAKEFVSEGDSLEILFMSKTAKLKLLWGTPSKILSFDKALSENYRFGLSGDYEVQIGDPRKCYLYLVGVAQDLTSDGLQERLMSQVLSTVEEVVLDFIDKNSVLFNKIILYKKQMSQKILEKLSQKLLSEYGITVFSLNIANIIIDAEDFKRLSNLLQKDKIVCSYCGTKLSEDAKFCLNCGKAVGQDKICPNCNSSNSLMAKFCSNCGFKLEEN